MRFSMVWSFEPHCLLLLLLLLLQCLMEMVCSTEIDNIANEIVFQSQTELDINLLWEKIDVLQKDINNYQDTVQASSSSVTTEEVDIDCALELDTKSFKDKLSLIPLQKDTIESILPNLAIDVAKLYSKYGLFYVDIEKGLNE